MIDKIRGCEIVGHVGSPSSSTELKVTVEEHAYSKGLVGNFCVIPFIQDGKHAFSIGQIVSTELRNPYLESHSVEKIVSVRGEASPLTEKHDVLNVVLVPGSTYSVAENSILPSTMATVPPTGTPVYLLGQPVVNEIVTKCRQTGIGYLGYMYNTSILAPMFFKHFGKPEEGGLGEAYHIGIFGITGSGKSCLARMIISLYARSAEMSILVVDRTGEYVGEIRGGKNLCSFLTSARRTVSYYGVSQIALDTPEALGRVVLTNDDFLRRMHIVHPENQERAANIMAEFFRTQRMIALPTGARIQTLPNAAHPAVFDQMLNHIGGNITRIYATPDKQREVLAEIGNPQGRQTLFQYWRPIASLFAGRTPVGQVLEEAIVQRKIVFVDLSDTSAGGVYWNDRVLAVVLDEILKRLQAVASSQWVKTNELINTLVVIDEAHRFVPHETPVIEEFKSLKTTIVKGVLETRKYGLGWMFISQSLAGLDPDLLKQLRLLFVGYGLTWGFERRVLSELVGEKTVIDLYSSFKDPQTMGVMGKKEYSFMVVGPSSPLSISGKPIFINALDYSAEFGKLNQL